MEFTGRYPIAAPPEAVWQGLNDPGLLKVCIPGCEQMAKTGPADFAATVTLRIGPMKATFQGKVTLTDQAPPLRCTLTGEGQGGVAGFAKGEALVVLSPKDGGTELAYTANARVGGKLAQVGQRLVDGAARQLADQFFAAFSAALAPPLPDVSLPDGPLPDSISSGPPRPETAGRAIWMAGLIAVTVILILMFTVVM